MPKIIVIIMKSKCLLRNILKLYLFYILNIVVELQLL